jgi:hypothetical protein
VHKATLKEGIAVGYMHIRLNNPDKFFARVVEIKLDFVGRGTDGFISSELKLLNEVFVRVLCHASALVGVKEDVVDVERGGNKGLSVSVGDLAVVRACGRSVNLCDSEKALVERADFDVNLDFVILKSNQRKSKTGVAAEPKLKWDIESSLRKGVAGSADGLRDIGGTASGGDISESRVGKVCKLAGLSNHLVVSGLLLTGKGKLVPDVHPVTILTVDALTTNLNLNHRNHLLTWAVKPACVHMVCAGSIILVDFWECNLKVCSVGKISVSGDSALDTATEISLSVKSLFNRFHCEVSVTTVGYLPEGNLRVTCKVNILCAVSYELH